MTIKKLTVIAAAGAVLLAGAIGLSMSLTSQHEMEIEVPAASVVQGKENEDGSKTLGDMENIPLYYDETKKLLLPLRNVMEGLGGSVKWNQDTRMTEIAYRGRTLALTAGEEQALLNGYEVTLPEAAEIINGCLYVDEALISAYYTGDVDFDIETRQVTLQTKDNTVPVVAVNTISGKTGDRAYKVDVPVVIGLNDSNYEKNLNKEFSVQMQEMAKAFLQEDGDGTLQLAAKTGMCTRDFISLYWEGEKSGLSVRTAKNIDLMAQKAVTLADMLETTSLQKAKDAAGDGWTEGRFFLTAEGGLVLLKGSDTDSRNMYYWTAEGEQLVWKASYQTLFQKK